jgi:hypothetical protein
VEGTPTQQRVNVALTIAGGKVAAVSCAPTRPGHWSATVATNTLALTHEALTGGVTIAVRSGYSDAGGTYVLALDGKVIGNRISGTLTTKRDDKAPRGPFVLTGSF